MRILFWCDSFYPLIGGAEVLGAELLRALHKRGFELAVVARRDGAEFAAYERLWDIPVYRFPFVGVLQSRDPAEMLVLNQQLTWLKRTFRPHVVHLFQCSTSGFFDLLTDAAHPAPHLLTLHGSVRDDQLAPGTLRHRLMQRADRLTTCSAALLHEIREQMPEITNRSCAIPNCVEMPTVVPEPLPFSPPRLLCLGRLVTQKGFDVALAAFARLHPRFPDMRLTIAGDGAEKSNLEAMARRLGIADCVEFRGWVQPDRVPGLLNESTLVVMPSRYEPFGIVALQAAQMARPLVATRVGGLPEVVADGETGMLVRNDDADAMVTAILFLLEHSDAAARMGDAARRRAEQVFSWNKFVEPYASLYERLSNQLHYNERGGCDEPLGAN